MNVTRVYVILALLVAGCSGNNQNIGVIEGNPLSLLEADDPHVCVNPEVEKLLISLLKSHVNNETEHEITEQTSYYTSNLNKINVDIGSVQSQGFNTQNHMMSCSAQVTMSAPAAKHDLIRSVSYDISPNLSEKGAVIVSADTSKTADALGALIIITMNDAAEQQAGSSSKQAPNDSDNDADELSEEESGNIT